MKAKPTPLGYFIGFGLAGLVVGPIVSVLLGWIWMEHYTRTTGFDAGNAPPFFFAFGLLVGPVVFALLGKLIHRISSSTSN
jgi:hypothetical protein